MTGLILIDTSIAIELGERNATTLAAVRGLSGRPLLSIISRIELENGVTRTPTDRAARRALLDALLGAVTTVDFTASTAEVYRRLAEVVVYSRRKVIDRMIAAQALEHRAALLTLNPNDFADVPGLDLRTL